MENLTKIVKERTSKFQSHLKRLNQGVYLETKDYLDAYNQKNLKHQNEITSIHNDMVNSKNIMNELRFGKEEKNNEAVFQYHYGNKWWFKCYNKIKIFFKKLFK